MNALLTLPVLLPALAGGLSLALSRHSTAQRLVSLAVLVGVSADAAALLVLSDRHGPQVVAVGGWPAPIGIALVADRLSALLLLVAVLVALAVLLFAIGQGAADESAAIAAVFHPAYLLLIGGIGLAFLAGDLFNLFVAFEMMLASSYVLITLDAAEPRVRAGMTYVMTSLMSSLLFLTAIALLYSATGTVTLADLGDRTGALPDGLRTALSLLLLVVFGIKAAVVPLHFWLPDSYPAAPAPITAVFAALLTKVGVYAMVRTQTLLFPRTETWVLLAAVATVALLVGILGALAQDDINRLLSFALVSHIGFMLFGLALFDVTGLTGTILYMVHHITAQATLFLVSGLVVTATGTASLRRMRDRAGSPQGLAALFFVPALSLSGIPPLAGFAAKLTLLRAGVAAGDAAAWAVTAGAVVTSLLTLYAMLRLWRGAFSRPRPPAAAADLPAYPDRPGAGGRRAHPLMLGVTVGMVLGALALAALIGPLGQLSERAAADLLNPGAYREAVLGEESS